eukprot:412463_1
MALIQTSHSHLNAYHSSLCNQIPTHNESSVLFAEKQIHRSQPTRLLRRTQYPSKNIFAKPVLNNYNTPSQPTILTSSPQVPMVATSRPSIKPLQQQELSFDIILEREINRIINKKLKDQQQEQRLNFISVCKVLNKTYENSDKLDGIINKFNVSDNRNQNKIDCGAKYMSEIMDFMKQIDNNQRELFQKLNGIQSQQNQIIMNIRSNKLNNTLLTGIKKELDDLKSGVGHDFKLLNKQLLNINNNITATIDDNQNTLIYNNNYMGG